MTSTRGMIEVGGLAAAVTVGGIASLALVPSALSLASLSVAGLSVVALAGIVGGTSLIRRRPGHHGVTPHTEQGSTSAYSYPTTGEC